MATPRTPEFLTWIADRLVGRYGENEHTDFVLRLREEAERARTLRANLSLNRETYQLVSTGTAPDMDGRNAYLLSRRGRPGKLGSVLHLTGQEAEDISRQLDAPIDYFND